MGTSSKYLQDAKSEKTNLTIYPTGNKASSTVKKDVQVTSAKDSNKDKIRAKNGQKPLTSIEQGRSPLKGLSYNPLNDLNLGRRPTKNIDISKLTDKYHEQQPGSQKDDSGNIGGGDYPNEQPDSYTKGTIGKPTPPVQVDDGQHNDGVKTAAAQPDDKGTGGLSGVTVDRQNITITFWDHGTEDGDIINIYLNGKSIKRGIKLKKSKRSFPVQLNSGKNRFEVEAVNEGTISPNTASVRISNVTKGKALQIYERKSGQKASMSLTAP